MISRKELVRRFQNIQAASVADVLQGVPRDGTIAAMDPRIKSRTPGLKFAGPAYTVLLYPFDSTSCGKALEKAKTGDVLVVAGGSPNVVNWGELYARRAAERGIAGLVTDGATRDLKETADLAFPQFTAGVSVLALFTPKENAKEGAEQIPVLVGGVLVRPGDWMVGDDDGVVVIPRDRVFETLEKAESFDKEGEVNKMRESIGVAPEKKSLQRE